jgi:hypothetical protein
MARLQNTSSETDSKCNYDPHLTEIGEFIGFSAELFEKYPQISESIEQDLTKAALAEKAKRIEEKQYFAEQTPSFKGFDLLEECEPELMLEDTGRKRILGPLEILVFQVLRGRYGSVTSQSAYERFKDSRTLDLWLASTGRHLPSRSSLGDTLNVISINTLNLILDCQLGLVSDEGLDDFSKVAYDSTSVAASTEWPTDSALLFKLLNSIYNLFKRLEKSGFSSFRKGWCDKWIDKVRAFNLQINLICGKPNSSSQIRKIYKDLLKEAQKAHDHMIVQYERVSAEFEFINERPAVMSSLTRHMQRIRERLEMVTTVLYYTENRVMNGVKLKAADKILSISDRTAAFIKKGQRDPVIGYKPQIGRSGNGFIVASILVEGNCSDSKMLRPLVEETIKRTGIVPSTVSVDDGYASAENRDWAFSIGIKVFSISGSKGKNVLGEELWGSEEYMEARNWRSAVESTMFELKYGYDMRRMRRRGVEEVKADLLVKVIALNCNKAVTLRKAAEKAA